MKFPSLPAPSLNWLLVFVPAAIVIARMEPGASTLVFVFSCLAIIPLAGLLGTATEHLAERTGEGIGGLLNATFGNAAELIIALSAIRAGLHDVVKASITGSIIGNILLVMGAAFLGGGLKFQSQRFNVTAARSQATTLTLASVALIMPAMYHLFGGKNVVTSEADLSLEISFVLIITYALTLVFALRTHKQLFAGGSSETRHALPRKDQPWPVSRAVLLLATSTLFIAWVSEILVGSVEHAAADFGMTSVFVGVIIVAIIGNAAEHSTAVIAAVSNRMDLSIGIAIGSSVQVALFVAPVLVFASHFIGPRPMDLVFTPLEVVSIALSTLIIEQTTSDGESNWLEGVQLLSVYAILGIIFYFLRV
jgi:Ca2+:H+ antiporter